MTKKPAGTYIRKSDIARVLARTPVAGKRLLPLPARVGPVPFGLLEDTTVRNAPEIHDHEGDLWHCLDGKARFVYGGRIVGQYAKKRVDGTPIPGEHGGRTITGGTKLVLKPGDWLWIPPGVPHQHGTRQTARLIIIKIPAQ